MSTPRQHLQDRCAVCGWPLAETRENGCRPGDCSMRPFPEHIFDLERANREYAGRHEFKGDLPCYVDDKTGRVVHRGGCGECPAEGVPAPLEPSQITAKKFYDENFGIACKVATDGLQAMFLFAEAYAAAVSKNLIDKYAEMEAKWMRELLTVSDEIGEARDRISQAEGMIGHYLASGYLPRMSAEEAREWLKEIAALPKNGRWNAALDKGAEMLSRMEVIAGQPRATLEKAVVEIRKLKEIAALRETHVKP